MRQVIQRQCKHHGLTDFSLQGLGKNQRFRCKKCLNAAVSRKRVRLKVQAIAYKGGKCVYCGYSKCKDALEFHHKDPTQKDFGISQSGNTRSWEKIRVEVDKCDLVCANCHREIHSEINNT